LKKNRAYSTRRSARSSGFTLFEVVVALAIAAMGLGALMAATSQGLGNAQLADRYIEATRRAQSRLAELGKATLLVPGVQSGDDGGGFSWRVRIAPPATHDAPPANGVPALALYTVEATVSWQSGGASRSVSLQSLRLAHP
jgi:general secretion pathway protein I